MAQMTSPSSLHNTAREQIACAIPDNVKHQVMSMLSGNGGHVDDVLTLMNNALSKPTEPSTLNLIKAICLAMYDPNVPLAKARSVFNHLMSSIMTLNDDFFLDAATFLLAVHQLPNSSRSFALESMLLPIRERMSAIYEQRNEWFKAANELTRIPDQGFACTVRIARLFIAAGLVDRAEYYLSRATTHLNSCNDSSLRLQHRICYARVLDLKGKFEDAAHRYYMLANDSQSAQLVDAMTDTQVPALVYAVTCAILAPAGPRRSRLLAMLYNDERSQRLEIFPLLESIHMGRLLDADQVNRFRPTLQPHQLMLHPDGDTVLDRAVIEHNVLAVSRMYTNIGLHQLGALLNVSPKKAEKTARVMINENRMSASIDQVEHRVNFSNQNSISTIEHWDALIASLCGQVDDCVEAIVNKFPSISALV